MKYALLGYTYQHYVASLLLALMDVERKIDWMGLEVDVNHKFDDIIIKQGGKSYAMQLKDIDKISIEDLSFKHDQIEIKGSPHKLSNWINVLFFKGIKLQTNSNVLGFPAKKVSGVYLVSMSREEIEKRLSSLYKNDPHRRQLMQHFLAVRLDERRLELSRSELPSLAVFDTRLSDKTIIVARQILDFQDILYIEGKPGVGKSHLVSLLAKQFRPCLLYRFWISNQDKDYEERLKFSNFKIDLSKKLFFDQKERSEEQILAQLDSGNETLIIDGLDHVENYRHSDLSSFIDFFDRMKECCKVIVLGRPLVRKLPWRKQVLRNWNFAQTKRVLKSLYHIEDYSTQDQIYQLTAGYPILVKYIAEQYKKEKVVPDFGTLNSVNAYYDQLLARQGGKSILSVFLCCRGFLMSSELEVFLGELTGTIVREFVAERPYLFERRLNRISLYHDSLNTYLKNSAPDIAKVRLQVNSFVIGSLLNNEKRFQSRVAHFDLDGFEVVKLVKHYSSIKNFGTLMHTVVDFEAVQEFYAQLREMLCQMQPSDLEIVEFYELTLILNLTTRDHFSTINGFYFTYAQLLRKYGYTEEVITSNGYLFGMLLYLQNKDATHLYNLKSDRNYDTSRFYQELENELNEEAAFFKIQTRPFDKRSIDRVLNGFHDISFTNNITQILVNVYLHPLNQKRYPLLFSAIYNFFHGKKQLASRDLEVALQKESWNTSRCLMVLQAAKAKLLELGADTANNDYLNLTLNEYLRNHRQKGSFELWPEVLGYLRLSLERDREIDIQSISAFFTKYHQRKDYTLYSVDQALTVFEEQGVLEWKKSVKLIQYLQEISEKGYGGLMGSYLQLHKPSFLLDVLAEFPLKTLKVSWFKLPSEFLEMMPGYVYEYEVTEQLRYHSHSRDIPVTELRNLFSTKWLSRIKKDLDTFGFKIALDDGDEQAKFLTAQQILYKVNPVDTRYMDRQTPHERFQAGILDDRNAFLIVDMGLTPTETSLMADGNYDSLADPSIYNVFQRQVLREEMKTILFNLLTSRSGQSGSFNATWLLPGNILRLLSDTSMPIDFNSLFESFKEYLSLSMLEFEND